VEEFVSNTFDIADVTKRGKISIEEWISMAMNNYVYIQSLGLLHEDNSCINENCSKNHLSKNSLLVQFIQVEMAGGKKKGIPISFGHHSWDICYYMMLGMRHAVT
jgi:ribosome-interacting GTPase 1